MKKHLSKILITALALWVITLMTPAKDFISLTGLFHLPIPDGAENHPVDENKEYYLEEVADDVYFITGWSHNSMFVVAQTSVVVVDAPPSIGDKYLDAIQEVTDKPVSHLIYSHSHDDHIGSAGIFKGATVISHEITADILRKKSNSSIPVPDITFDRAYTLDVGGKHIELEYHGPAHGPGNISIYLPQEKVLTMIDIAFPKWIPIHEFAIAEDIEAYYEVYDVLLAKDFNYFIGGHARLGTYEDVKHQQEYAEDVRKSATKAYKSVGLTNLGKRSAKAPNTLLAVNFGLNRLASQCEQEVVEKWKGILASVDVFTHSHCKRMVFHAMTN